MLSSPDAVCYATGHPIPIGTGPSPFTGGPALPFVGRQDGGGIVCANVEAGGLLASLPAEVYAGFAGLVTDQFAGYRAAVTRMIRQLGVGGKLAVQQASHPFSVADLFPRAMTLDVALDRIRAVKTAREISALRQAAKVASAGQLATRRLSLVGASEQGVLNFVRSAMESLAGERCALAGQYLGGIEHTATLVTPPEPRLLLPGDPVICDFAPGLRATSATVVAALQLSRPSTLGLRLSKVPTKPWRWRLQPCGLR